MIRLATIPHLLRSTILVIGLVVLAAGCSKRCDDHAQPDDATEETGTARNFSGSVNDEILIEKPSGVTYRNAEPAGTGLDDEGISDDGDDEADGEGSNKKGRQ